MADLHTEEYFTLNISEQEIGNNIYIYYEPNTLEEAQRNMLSSIARKANSDSGKVSQIDLFV